MSLQTRSAVGYSGGQVAWTGPDECAWTCGNAVVLHSLGSKAQRVLKGTGFGISCFAVNKRHGLLAIAEKGLKPLVTVYSTKTLQPLAKLMPGDVREQRVEGVGGSADKASGSGPGASKQAAGPSVVLGVTCLAFSTDGERLVVCGDEPDCSVIVYGWRKAEVLGRSRMPAAAGSVSSTSPASAASFHPLDASVLATSGPGGACAVWFLEPLWEKSVFRPLQLAPGALPAGAEVTCHCWGPAGLYAGTSTGGLVLLDPATMAPLQLHAGAGGAAGEGAAGGSGGTASPTPGASSGGAASGGVPAVVPDAVASGAAVTALALNRDLVAVAAADGSVRVFTALPAGPAAAAAATGPPSLSHEVWLGRAGPARGMAVASAECGGGDHATLLLGCPDGTVYRAPLAPKQGGGATHSALVVDCHTGRLAGVVPHPGGGAFVTTGSDGSVRVWSATDGALLGRKQLSSAQTALAAAAPGASLVAVGSETGVVRVMVLPPATSAASAAASDAPLPALRVLFRQRLHSSPVDVLVFSPANDLLLSAGRDGNAWLCSVDARGGRVRPLGCLPLPPGERVLSATWPRSAHTEHGSHGSGSGHTQAGHVSSTPAEGDEPSCLLSLAGGGLMCLTASAELHSGNWRNPHADMALVRPLGAGGGVGAGGGASRALGSDTGEGAGVPELVTIKLLRLEVPMLALAAVPGDRYGDTYGLGADKQLHKLVLPAEAAAWAGLRARPLRSAQHVPAHARASGGVALAPGGHLLASGAADGTVALRNMSLIALAQQQQGGEGAAGTNLHDITAGGVVTVSFDATGRYLASAGADGALIVYELVGSALAGPQHLVTPPPAAAPPALPAGSAAASRAEGGDDFDDPTELTAVAAARRDAAMGGVEGAAGGESKRAAVASRLATLRARIADLLTANEAAPELERLTRNEMIVDVGLVEELQRETERRVAGVQADVKKEHLRTELLAERVRRMVWDSMAVKGAVVSGLRAPLRVHNFPLTQPGQHERVLKQVTMLRRVELAEQAALGMIPYGLMFRGKGLEGLLGEDDLLDGTHSTADIAAAVAAAAAAATAAAAASAAAGGAGGGAGGAAGGAGAGGAGGGAAPASELDALLYSDFDVYCNTRKALQVQLLKQKMRDVQAAFNTEFNKVAAAKKADCDRIADLNARLDDTLKDLRKLGAGPPAGLLDERFSLNAQQDTRDNLVATVLTVRDDEVSAERYVSPAERAKQEAARKADEEAAKRSAKDNAGERALRQMMGGTLAARGGGHDDSNPFSLPKPAWLVALGVDPDAVNPKLITEEQNRELKEWQAKEKSLQEERAKRITVLEMELRTAKAAVEELVGRFDDSLAALAARRHRAASEVCALEARIVMLAAGLRRCAKTSEAVERGLLARLGAAKEAHGRAAGELSERRAALEALEARQAQLGADERLMDRNFKKEFAEADIHVNRLLQLYRARKPEQLVSTPGGPAGGHQGPAGGEDSSSGSFSRVQGGAPGLHGQASLAHSPSGAAAGGEASSAAMAAGASGASSGGAPTGGAGAGGPPANITPTYTHALPLPPAVVAATTLDPFPDLPPGAAGHDRPSSSSLHPSHSHANVHGSHSHHHLSAAAAAAGQADPLHNLSGLKPEGLDAALWERFVAYRAERLAAEAGARAAAGDLVVARRDLPELEAREAALSSEMEGLMGSITALRSERKVAAYDNEVQLRLLAGQVEALPPRAASSDMSDARLLGRGVVESLNSVVLGKGTKKVELLTAMKDFKRGIYAAQWEAQAADMRLDDLRAKIRDLQLLHVTRDMQTVLKDGEDRSSALEAANLEALMKQRERLHAKALEDKRRRLRKLAADVTARSAQNQEVAVHLVTLGKVLEEQQRLQAGMQSANDQATRRMRSLVTHKKLKEIALAQQNELGELRQQLEKLRLRTYPTFIESGAVAGMPSLPPRLPPDIKLLTGSPSSSVAGRT
ncbi:hypothetical protein HYH02_007780 [Chlamydomonas schloesseri]|uniref:Cilia- and flagella-associated protein 43 n=1 Tax=Chlamydomonas schloesseri TaxID=2026947 RepID=A0A836B4M3_9CHLO|nr:hypothetical protein HYH02_007780 [Chlamydomonas schloesseri]|eukprot:KAG2447457.1 hypothetical protein HYH02_007780 [Chlamydomonas schloesseri]